MNSLTRRGFLAAGAAVVSAAALPRAGMAGTAPLPLTATRRVLDVDGRAATVFGLTGPSGPGLVLDPGQAFRVELTNALPEPTLIHWHGQIPPNVQDGVPDAPMPPLQPGERRTYDFAPQPGTHWMHSHIPLQEMQMLAAPLIVRRSEERTADRQEVVMFLHDFSFRSPEEVMERITGGQATGQGGMDHGSMNHAGHGMAPAQTAMPGMADGGMSGHDMSGHDMAGMMSGGGMPGGGMAGMAMDLNDYDWDAYLANDRTLSDPEVVSVERGGRVLLRIINAAAATVFFIDTGDLPARLVATDGHGTQPVAGTRFGLAMGQRIDLEIDLPASGAWPVLALREGARERTGLILATPGAAVRKVSATGEAAAPAFDTDLAQESRFVALEPLPQRTAGRRSMLMLGGSMQPYRWTINGRVWSDHIPVAATSGERIELTFHNMSMMGHPMHLHGHAFQVIALNGTPVSGARRDTVYVPPMAMVTVAVDAGEAAPWMLHCHHMPHLATGMMTVFAVA